MIISYSWLNSFFKKPLPRPDKLAELLTLHSFENESVEAIKNDWILNLDVLPDRAGDCLSHLGIARECFAITGLHFVEPVIKFKESKTNKIDKYLEVEVKDVNCRRYSCKMIRGVKVEPSPKWIQEKLQACNINPINNIVDATNYVMLELGQPLHVFDYDKIAEKKIIVKKAKPGELIGLLKGDEVALDKTMMTISDTEGVLAIAGIKGGKKAEVDEKTCNIVIESANFNAKLISQTARKLNIRTDASIRFENNIDPNLTQLALDRVVTILMQITPGEVLVGTIDIYPDKVHPLKLRLSLEKLSTVLGVVIAKKDLELIIKRLNFKITQETAKYLTIEVPTARQDIILEENLIEEIGRIYGYEKINPILPCNEIIPAKKDINLYWQDKVRDIMKNLSWIEVYNYSFIGEEEKKHYSLDPISINNPVSVYFKYIRPTLMPHLIKNCFTNLNEFQEVSVYEISKVFSKSEKKFHEARRFSGVACFNDKNVQLSFQKMKGVIEYLLRELGISKVVFVKITKDGFWENGNAVNILIEKEKIGSFGQVSMELVEELGSDKTLMGFDFDFDAVLKCATEEREYRKISNHPPAIRDISGLLNEDVSEEMINEALDCFEKSDPMLDVEISVVDVYRKNVPSGFKSITLRVVLQHSEKTLKPELIDNNIRKIIKHLSEKIGWEERK